MPLSPFSCTNCDHWQRYFAVPPDCPVYSDVRNDLPQDGWEFVTPEQVLGKLTHHWREVMPGLWEFWSTPRYGLDGHGWLLLHPDGNLAFEAAPLYSAAALAKIEELGGIRWLGASHPHGYGALYQLQDHFQPDLLIQREDLQWTKAFRVTVPYDEVHEIRPGLTLHHIGGHYEGQSVLYDAERRALFCGDALKFDDVEDDAAQGISCHKAAAFTPFECATNIDTAAALRLLDDVIEGPPHTRAISIRA